MSLSMATGIHTTPMLNKGFSSTKCASFTESHLTRSLRASPSVRAIVYNTRDQLTVLLQGSGMGFDPLQCRRSIGRASALNARCGVAETQTISRKSSSATIVSPPGKETLPMLDDGGSGFRGHGYAPYYRGDGSGGDNGGGGGGFRTSGEFPWGDFWFYIFLFLLRFLIMNMIGEGSCVYKYEDGRNKPLRRYV